MLIQVLYDVQSYVRGAQSHQQFMNRVLVKFLKRRYFGFETMKCFNSNKLAGIDFRVAFTFVCVYMNL